MYAGYNSPMGTPSNNLISIADAAVISGLTTSYLRRMLREKRLGGHKFGQRCWLIDRKKLLVFLENRAASQGK